MNFVTYLAHSEAQHVENTSQFEHFLTQPLIALSLYIVLMIALFSALNRGGHKKRVLPVLLGVNLLIGLGAFSLVPAVSIAAITLGIALALVVALGSIVG